MILLSCLCSGLIFVYSVDKVSSIYVEQSKDSILELKKTFLKDTVNNLIDEIDIERASQSEIYNEEVAMKSAELENSGPYSREQIVSLFKDECWTIVFAGENWSGVPEDISADYVSYNVYETENIKVFYGVKTSYVDNIVKNIIKQNIHNSSFSGGSYMWINEVINYDGGDNYAIRFAHPNLPETEGSYLSTNTGDGYGNYPYLEELEGVKKNGEVYFSYYFKNLGSDEVTPKITYSKLYSDYNWIIAMGVQLDDIQSYVDQTQQKSIKLTTGLTVGLGALFIVIILFSFIFIRKIDRWFYWQSNKELEKELNQDPLTKSYSRRKGTEDLIKFFKEFKKVGESPAIMIIDIDNFKQINDTYGHNAGDMSLIEVVNTINQSVRNTDHLIRWGGDEFIGVFFGLRERNAIILGEKILSEISKISLEINDQKVSVTASIGISFFRKKDTDYTFALKRADEALYKSKEEGKNRVNLNL